MFENIRVIHNSEEYGFSDIQKILDGRKPKDEYILSHDDNFAFILDFIEGTLSEKEIFVVPDSVKAKSFKYKNSGRFINYCTSGSTGEPKVIKKTVQELINECRSMNNILNLPDNCQVLTTTKLTHLFGMSAAFFYPLLYNLPINADIITFPEQIKTDNFILITTPSFLDKMYKYGETLNLPHYIIAAGDKLKKETYEYFSRYSKVIEMYGSTETALVAYNIGNGWFKPLDDVLVSKTEDNRIIVNTAFCCEKEVILNDIIELSNDGTFKIINRADRILKVQEKRISAVELEDYLKKSEYIEDAYCFKFEEKIAAAAVPNQKGLEYHLKNNDLKFVLKNYMKTCCDVIPQKWRFLYEIPKTITGKIDKNRLIKIFSSELSLPVVLNKVENENIVKIELQFKRNSNFFKGHFPEVAILPGVVQLYYAHYYAEDVFMFELRQNLMKKIKFSKVIFPDTKIILWLENNENSVDFRYTDFDDNTYSSGTFIK